MLLSLWRTFVPYLVGFGVARAAAYGLDIDAATLEALLVLAFGAAYHAMGRLLEQHAGRRWGWLLGFARQPVYPRNRAQSVRETPETETSS
jgi:hypothetical protein